MPLGCPPADKFKVMTLPLAGLMCRLGPDDPFLGTAVRWIRASSKLAQTEVGLSCGKSDGAELHHQEQPITGIRGPSADAIGMTPAKAERVCIDSPLEGTGFKLPVPGRNRMAFRGLARSAPGIGAADVLGSLPDSPLEGNGFEPSVPRCA